MMLENTQNTHDASHWARAIRRLAHDSYRVVRAEVVDPVEIDALITRIERLQDEIDPVSQASIHRWLENLRGEVDDANELSGEALIVS